jgi:hypothetical protein
MESKSTFGYDELSIKVMKLSVPFTISPLTHICNSVLSSGVFPDRLKYAIFKPIFKNGSRDDISNYRPISILTSFSKIFKKLMFNRLYNHFESNGILAQEEFGFRLSHSTEQAAFCLINRVLLALNDKQLAGGIFCDLQKAFDCVNHKILLDKLHLYGIHGKFITLMESYLTNRYQKVSLSKMNFNHNSSNWTKLNCGVPQGSILGPFLFLVYINDLPTIINRNNNIILFADDTSLIFTGINRKDFSLQVNMFFKDINTWLDSNLLNLNFNKTHYMEFKAKKYYKHNMLIQYNKNYIKNATEAKFLGLVIDETLSWSQHILQLTKRMATACYALRCIKHSLPIHTLKIIYSAHVHSIMSYGLIFWGSASCANNVFLLQKRIIRTITNAGPRDSCRNIFRKLQIFTLYSQYIYSLLLFPIKNKQQFATNKEVHEYNTRNLNNLHPSMINLTKFKKGPYIMCIKVFNHLPQSIKDTSNNPNQFRTLLKRFLHHHSFYSLEEYFNHRL